MRRVLRLGTALLLTMVLVLSFVNHARADTFNQNNIMDDAVFDNAGSMNASQINNWLNANFPSSCISTNNGFSSPDPTGYNPSQGFLYGGNVSAGQVIYDAGQAYGLNPQVILATLQKESSVVSGTASYHCQYINTAMGYGCPDGGSCPTDPATMSGFSKQVIHAAWLLKFGEQRSEGNTGWAVIKGAWDNSDDPQTCYGGPMTQGTFSRGPSQCGGGYFDGYTTIDGTAVHMDNGTTAALYWYTPHFSGNQHFFTLFTGWFGSTHYAQPLGASLYQDTSTGVIYLIDNSNSTRYQVPDWDMMVNYGLNYYPTQPVPDSTIQGLADGGMLTNLVYDNNGVYLVNNQTRHPVTAAMCPVWGFSCSDGNAVKPLGATFQTQYLQQGGLLTRLLKKSDGTVYELSAGAMQPVANQQTLSDLGFSTTPAITASAVNLRHPLGALLITTPGVLQFSPDPHIYYFDGTNYFTVGDMTAYSDWGLGRLTYWHVPVSSYNQTPPSSTLMNSWVISNSSKYIVDQGRKLLVPGSLASLWPDSQYTSSPPALFNSLPSGNLSTLVLAYPNIYLLSNGQKHYVQTIYEYLTLLSSVGSITNIQPNKINAAPQGNDALVDGDVIIVNNGSGIIYAVNNGGLTHVLSPNIFEAYGYSWGAVRSYPTGITSDYPIDGTALGNGRAPDSTHYIVSGSSLYQLSSSQAADFGAIDADFTPITKQAVRRTPGTMSRFLLNTDDGRVYYASGGALHYVSSYDSFVAYGGLNSPRISVNSATIADFTVGSPI